MQRTPKKSKGSDDSGDEARADSDSESEVKAKAGRKKGKKESPTKTKKAKKAEPEKSDVGTDEEFDDGLDEDLVGDDDDRKKLAGMTEREREEELFKRAEKREEARKRFVRLLTYLSYIGCYPNIDSYFCTGSRSPKS